MVRSTINWRFEYEIRLPILRGKHEGRSVRRNLNDLGLLVHHRWRSQARPFNRMARIAESRLWGYRVSSQPPAYYSPRLYRARNG
jgi:hypothetical protein